MRPHRISSALRSGLMIAAGTALIALPVALGLGSAAILTGITVGVIATGLGIAGTDTNGRGTLPLSAHAVYDRGLAVGLLLAGIFFGLADQPDGAGPVRRRRARPARRRQPHPLHRARVKDFLQPITYRITPPSEAARESGSFPFNGGMRRFLAGARGGWWLRRAARERGGPGAADARLRLAGQGRRRPGERSLPGRGREVLARPRADPRRRARRVQGALPLRALPVVPHLRAAASAPSTPSRTSRSSPTPVRPTHTSSAPTAPRRAAPTRSKVVDGRAPARVGPATRSTTRTPTARGRAGARAGREWPSASTSPTAAATTPAASACRPSTTVDADGSRSRLLGDCTSQGLPNVGTTETAAAFGFAGPLPRSDLSGYDPPLWFKHESAFKTYMLGFGSEATAAMPEDELAAALPEAGIGENVHNKYIFGIASRTYGEVLVLRGKGPTFPRHVRRAPDSWRTARCATGRSAPTSRPRSTSPAARTTPSRSTPSGDTRSRSPLPPAARRTPPSAAG